MPQKKTEYRAGMDKDVLTQGNWYLLPFFRNGSVVVSKGEPAEAAPRWLIATVYHEEDSLDARVLAGAKEAYEIIRLFLKPELTMDNGSIVLQKMREYLGKIEGANHEKD